MVIPFISNILLLTDIVCLYTYKFWLSLCKIVRSSVILLLPLCIKFKIWAALQRCSPSYMRGLTFYSRGKYLHYRIIALRVVVLGPIKEFSLHPLSLLTKVWRYQRGNQLKVPVLSQECERSCIWVVGLLIVYLCFYDCSIWFRNCSDSIVMFVFHLYTI